MSCWYRIWFSVCVGWLGLGLGGCAPGQSGDQRDLHFALGESRLNVGDYPGAIRDLEQSVETNPRLAAAHFDLGWLYDQKVSDPAAAIYHYEQYLRLKPEASNADVVQQRIQVCKQELAAEVLALPATSAEQRQLENLVAQHQGLQDQICRLQANLSGWNAYYAGLKAARTNSAFVVSSSAVESQIVQPADVQPVRLVAAAQPASAPSSQSANPTLPAGRLWRTHIIAAGDTAYRIALRYGITLGALLAANPGLKPRRMPVGMVLNIPHSESYVVAASHSLDGGLWHDRERAAVASRTMPRLD